MRATVVVTNRQWRDATEPQKAVAEGLKTLGHSVEILTPEGTPYNAGVAFLWNGFHGRWGLLTEQIRESGGVVFTMERGFFDRMNYTQIDHAGFNHTASWAGDLAYSSSGENAQRFAQVWGAIDPIIPRQNGYILILGQVDGDSQLRDSEIHHADCLLRAVENCTPHSVEIRFRPHPLHNINVPADCRVKQSTGTLKDAIAGARFVITINSGAGNEALALGCPVLALGPSLYGLAGVALETSLANMAAKIKAMLAGYRPCQSNVDNYLRNLAGRQWNNEELATGEPLKKLIEAANV